MMIGIGDMEKFEAEETKEISQEVLTGKAVYRANRLMIPSHIAVDFVIVSASVKRKDVEAEVPLVSGGGTVPAVLYSETAFGLVPLELALHEGDVVKMKLRNLSKAPRQFSAALDCGTVR